MSPVDHPLDPTCLCIPSDHQTHRSMNSTKHIEINQTIRALPHPEQSRILIRAVSNPSYSPSTAYPDQSRILIRAMFRSIPPPPYSECGKGDGRLSARQRHISHPVTDMCCIRYSARASHPVSWGSSARRSRSHVPSTSPLFRLAGHA